MRQFGPWRLSTLDVAARADEAGRPTPPADTLACHEPRTPIEHPDGLIIELSRAKVLPGASAEADKWMKMLNERLDECVATLDRERRSIEIVFRLKENGEDYPFWMMVRGAEGVRDRAWPLASP